MIELLQSSFQGFEHFHCNHSYQSKQKNGTHIFVANEWMMKMICFLSAIVLSLSLHAQSFEGKITYKNYIQSKLTNVTDKQFTDMIGNKQDYYIKGNNYKSITNGVVMQWQLYVPEENKLYNKMSNTDVISWNDAAENKDSVLSAKVITNADTVLGYPCDKLILYCVGGVQEYEYNTSVAPVDASLFTQHKLANWYYVISRTHSLPLKSKLDNPQFTLTSTATAITPMKVDDSLFLLPAVAQTQKSRY